MNAPTLQSTGGGRKALWKRDASVSNPYRWLGGLKMAGRGWPIGSQGSNTHGEFAFSSFSSPKSCHVPRGGFGGQSISSPDMREASGGSIRSCKVRVCNLYRLTCYLQHHIKVATMLETAGGPWPSRRASYCCGRPYLDLNARPQAPTQKEARQGFTYCGSRAAQSKS